MIPGRVSVIVPSRNEEFFAATVRDILAKAHGDIEVLAVHEGYWDHQIPADPRVRQIHHGQAKGMRASINAAAAIATGQYLMKCDAHTMWDDGFDLKLKADYHEDNWILIPRRFALEPRSWAIDTSNSKYPIDYHYLSEPFDKHGDSVPGLHGSFWTKRRDERRAIAIDDELSTQGSAWFMGRVHFERIGPMNPARYGVFWYEAQELGLTTWLSGGAMKVTKNTWYAHLYKGTRFQRGYSTRDMGHEAATTFCSWFWMTDQPFAGRTRTMQSLVEQFSPVPTWPSDLDAVFARARREFKDPYAVAA
jgi:glycosyltransferase involved in cell wall biosynthesis